jgi:hypothetical protein
MSKNSQVRKIDLRANVDLANYRMDVHDYEGFCGCNSLFLNKRIQNWYTRSRGSSEVTGDLRIEANGDMFELWRNNTKLGEVSRNYYKLESYEGDTTRQAEVKNPFPQGKEGKLIDNHNKLLGNVAVQRLTSGYYLKITNDYVYIYNNNDELLGDEYLYGGNKNRVFGYYAVGNTSFTCNIPEFYVGRGGWDGRQRQILSATATLNLTAGDIFIAANNGYCRIFNVHSRTFRADALTLTATVHDSGGGDSDTNSVTSSDSGSLGELEVSVEGRDIDVTAEVYTGVSENGVYLYACAYPNSGSDTHIAYKITLNSNSLYSDTFAYNDEHLAARSLGVSVQTDKYFSRKIELRFRYGSTSGTKILYTSEGITPGLYFYGEFHNYSIKSSNNQFAINFVNNVARDISHNYKKLVNIEGNEDENGVLTDIINNEPDYVIFKKGNNYYKLSLAYADSWEEVVTKVGSDYLIFNTTTYNNAYYIPGDKWFCSCDDWNNRLIWRVKDSTNFEGLVNSRLNQNWQTKNYPVSVSDQLASVISRYAVTGLNMAAYPSGATWDGSSVVYDSSGNPVYTGDWAQGHSLNGYYYPLTWEINTAGMTPFYYDSTYTAPAGVAYDVFMADTSGGTMGALHKVGYADSTGFHSDPDSGTQFIDPSEGNYQFNCPLLDTTYLIFTTQAIAIIDNMSYILMNNVNMGNFVLLYREQDVATLTSDDRQFVINGSVYTYRAEAQRILDSNNRWVCDTHLFHYVGYSSRCAYFYCDFDKGLYAFSGDNTMNRLATVEKYNIRYSVGGDSAMLDTLNFPSLDLVLINLFTAVGVIYGDQFAVIDTGNITNWSIDDRRGLILINGVYYSLILANIQAGYTGEIGRLPIKIDTEYYGDPNNEDNTITDTVYLMIDNLNGVLNGNVKLRADVLQNNKVVKTEEKIFNLKSSDFNENIAQIKYQPKVQEGRGMKLYIESDYEISEMKFVTAPGALNQTTKRI